MEPNDLGNGERVLVIDADRRVQQSVAEVLRVAGLNVIGTAGEVRQALELIAELEPAVLVIDPRLPDIEAGSSLLSSVGLGWPDTRVVVMGWSGSEDHDLPRVDAFVSKSADPETFVTATIAACRC